MQRLPDEEFNFLVLHYLKSGRHKHLADSLETELLAERGLPKRILFNGSSATLTYDELLARFGSRDPNELIARFMWGAHENRLFPSIEGPLTINMAPNSQPSMEGQMEVDANAQSQLGPFPHISPRHRLLAPKGRGLLNPASKKATFLHSLTVTRLGTRNLPLHLRMPLEKYKKFHTLTRRKGHVLEVFFVIYDKTGSRIITASDDWLIKIWSAQTGLLVQTLRGHKQAITNLSVDPTNRYLASSAEDNTIRIWSLTSFAPLAVLQNSHTKPVVFLEWIQAPQSPVLVSAAQDGFIKIWEPVPNNVKDDIITLNGNETSLIFDLTAFDAVSSIQCGSVSAGGTRVLTGCRDGSIRIWGLNPPKMLQRVVGHGTNVGVVSWSHSDGRFLSAADDGTAKIWNFKNSDVGWQMVLSLSVIEIAGSKPRIVAAQWSLNDEYVLISYQRVQHGSNMKLFETKTGKMVGLMIGHTNDVHAMDVHPTDPRIIATAGYDQKITIWNVEQQEAVAILNVPNFEDEESPLTDIHFSPDGTQLVTCDITGTFTIFGLGPDSSYKGPIEQFFGTDYGETIVDNEGFVVDSESQTPPHLIPRGPLCFRAGRHHDNPPIPPVLNDAVASFASQELDRSRENRFLRAEIEENLLRFSEPNGPRLSRTTSTRPAPAAHLRPNSPPRNIGRSTRVSSTGVVNTGGRLTNARGLPARSASLVMAPPDRSNSRPLRNAARRATGHEEGLNIDVSDEENERAIQEAIKQLEDEVEEDFTDTHSDEDDSISSDGAGGRVRDAIDDDLYWSGNESFDGRTGPEARAARREAHQAHRQQRRIQHSVRREARHLGSNRYEEDTEDDDDDEDAFRPSGYPRRRSSNNQRSSNHQRPHPPSNRPVRSASRRIIEEESDDELPSEVDSEIDLYDSDNSASKPKSKKQNIKKGNKVEYPYWITQAVPGANYSPQLEDEVVFIKQAHVKYAEAYPQFNDTIPADLPEMAYCLITAIDFELEPVIHAILTLQTIVPQPTVPQIDTDPAHDPSTAPPSLVTTEVDVTEGRKLRVRIGPGKIAPVSLPTRPFVSMAQQAQQANGTSHNGLPALQQNSITFNVHYCPSESDILILATRFNASLAVPWFTGKPFGMWMISPDDSSTGEYYTGSVLDVTSESGPYEALTIVWDDDSTDSGSMQVSPWEIDSLDKTHKPIHINLETLSPYIACDIANAIGDFIKDHASTVDGLFNTPVPLNMYPDYRSIVPVPCDLGLIQLRLRNNYYRSLAALYRDVDRIKTNAILYNGEGEDISKAAAETSESVRAIIVNFESSAKIVLILRSPVPPSPPNLPEIPALPTPSIKPRTTPKSKKKKKRAFGIESDSDSAVDPEDLLPYTLPKKKLLSSELDSSLDSSVHHEDTDQRHKDSAFESSISSSRPPPRTRIRITNTRSAQTTSSTSMDVDIKSRAPSSTNGGGRRAPTRQVVPTRNGRRNNGNRLEEDTSESDDKHIPNGADGTDSEEVDIEMFDEEEEEEAVTIATRSRRSRNAAVTHEEPPPSTSRRPPRAAKPVTMRDFVVDEEDGDELPVSRSRRR